MTLLFILYNGLLIGFGLAVRDLARERMARRAALARHGVRGGDCVVALGMLGLALLALPMDPIGDQRTLTGAAHLVVAGWMAIMATAAPLACGSWLRREAALGDLGRFSWAMAAVIGVFGALTAAAMWQEAWAGLMERLLIGGYLFWMGLTSARLHKWVKQEGEEPADFYASIN
jgi:hypothetical protein